MIYLYCIFFILFNHLNYLKLCTYFSFKNVEFTQSIILFLALAEILCLMDYGFLLPTECIKLVKCSSKVGYIFNFNVSDRVRQDANAITARFIKTHAAPLLVTFLSSSFYRLTGFSIFN